MTQTERQTKNGFLSFESLDVYQLALRFHTGVMTFLPVKGERNLRDQLERASLSIILNIAEGTGRCTQPERRRHFIIALGSVYECAAILDVILLRGLVSPERCARARNFAVRIAQMLAKLARPSQR